jgi:hypothetical protein
VSDSQAVRDRLAALQARMEQPTPRPLEGQEAIPVDDDEDDGGPGTATQPALW